MPQIQHSGPSNDQVVVQNSIYHLELDIYISKKVTLLVKKKKKVIKIPSIYHYCYLKNK